MPNPVVESFQPSQISASANVCGVPAMIGGVFCSSSTAGTCTIYDDIATGTTTKIVDTFSLVAGTFYPLPFFAKNGVNVVIGGTAAITVGVIRQG